MTSPVDEGLVEAIAPIILECENEARNSRYTVRAVLAHLAATGRLTEATPVAGDKGDAPNAPYFVLIEINKRIRDVCKKYNHDLPPALLEALTQAFGKREAVAFRNGFQKSGATIVVHSMTSSSPADPPEGKVERRVYTSRLNQTRTYWNRKTLEWYADRRKQEQP